MKVTSKQIMKSLGIKNVKTLTRWHQQGLVPAPEIQTHPGGIGRIGVWPAWVLEHCRVIKQLSDQGQALDEIAETFGKDWQAVASRYRRYQFAKVSAKMDREGRLERLRQTVEDMLVQHLGVVRRRLQATALPPITRGLVICATDLARDGYNPVLVVRGRRTVVVPDFLISMYLSNHFKEPEPLIAIPLHKLVVSFLRAESGVSTQPSILTSAKVTRLVNGKKKECDCQVEDGWSFTIDRAKSRRKQRQG